MTLGVRQDQVQQADVREIVRQLVGEERPAGDAERAGLVHVLAPVRLEVLAAQVDDGFRVALVVRPIAADGVREPHQHRQLRRALDLAVARQDLLDQRRARARQADDQDRVRCVATLSRMLLEQLAREHGCDLLVAQLHRDGIVEHRLALPLVAGVVVMPGAVVVALVLVRLGQREAEMDVGSSRSGRRARAAAPSRRSRRPRSGTPSGWPCSSRPRRSPAARRSRPGRRATRPADRRGS